MAMWHTGISAFMNCLPLQPAVAREVKSSRNSDGRQNFLECEHTCNEECLVFAVRCHGPCLWMDQPKLTIMKTVSITWLILFNLFRCDVKCTFQHSALALNYIYGHTICDSLVLFVTFWASSVPLVTVHTHMLHHSYTTQESHSFRSETTDFPATQFYVFH
jgi:hypothetical protein